MQPVSSRDHSAVPCLTTLLDQLGPELFRYNANARKCANGFNEFFREIIRSPADTLTVSDLRAVRAAALNRGLAPLTINARCLMLKRLLALAVQRGIISNNPMDTWRSLKAPMPRNRIFMTDERERLWCALCMLETDLNAIRGSSFPNEWSFYASPLTPKLLFAMMTGVNLGPCNALSWDACNLTGQTIHIPIRNAGSRLMPISESLCDLLRRWRSQCLGPLMFPNLVPSIPGTSAKASWAYVARHANIQDLRWRDFRTDFGGHLIGLGAPAEHVRYLKGLSSGESVVDEALFEALRATLSLRDAYCPSSTLELSRFAREAQSAIREVPSDT